MSEIAAALAAPFSANGVINALLLVADALIYFAVLAGLFRARHRIGIYAGYAKAFDSSLAELVCLLGLMVAVSRFLPGSRGRTAGNGQTGDGRQ